MEKELKALSESAATKEDFSRVRAEMKKLYDGLHVGESKSGFCMVRYWLNTLCVPSPSEFLDLRAHVWGIRE